MFLSYVVSILTSYTPAHAPRFGLAAPVMKVGIIANDPRTVGPGSGVGLASI
jgi:hypothetical protein